MFFGPFIHHQSQRLAASADDKTKKPALLFPSDLLFNERAQISFLEVLEAASDICLKDPHKNKSNKKNPQTAAMGTITAVVSERRWDVRRKKGILMERFILYVFTCCVMASGNKAIMEVVQCEAGKWRLAAALLT